ncbi:MAG: 1-acyl-sn-glycerol-3-phosphate acyltransferase [Planctomycetota bacterium]
MQDILIEKPYQFTPPIEWHWPQRMLTRLGQFTGLLRKKHGVVEHECRNLDLLRGSLDAGHGVMLTPNHPRTADPIAMYHLCRETPVSMYTMASWHLFNQTRFTTFMIRLMGAFSVNREGLDRKAVDYAIDVLVKAKRPLTIFPSGSTSRINDRLMAFMEGPAFIARTAAKRRAKLDEGKVVIHPIAIKYFYGGDIESTCNPVLDEIEHRLSWKPSPKMPMIDRIVRIGNALLTLKELQYDVHPNMQLSLRERQDNMVDHLLHPIEVEWLGDKQSGGIQTRVKALRMKIFPEMTKNEVDDAERARRWEHLERTYLAQQIDCYPENYVAELPSVDRILETVEKFEEDLCDQCRIHGKLKVVLDVCDAIEVSPKRVKGVDTDPLIVSIRESLNEKLAKFQHESELYKAN